MKKYILIFPRARNFTEHVLVLRHISVNLSTNGNMPKLSPFIKENTNIYIIHTSMCYKSLLYIKESFITEILEKEVVVSGRLLDEVGKAKIHLQ